MSSTRDKCATVLRFCHQFVLIHGWCASYQEIAEATGYRRDNVVKYLQRLNKLDYIEFAGNRQYKVIATDIVYWK